jgi:hypothetical protein
MFVMPVLGTPAERNEQTLSRLRHLDRRKADNASHPLAVRRDAAKVRLGLR